MLFHHKDERSLEQKSMAIIPRGQRISCSYAANNFCFLSESKVAFHFSESDFPFLKNKLKPDTTLSFAEDEIQETNSQNFAELHCLSKQAKLISCES